jgi:hypothetical protein
VRALSQGCLRSRLQCRSPADCRPAAGIASGWAEAPGCDFAPKVRTLSQGRLRSRLQGRSPADCRPAAHRFTHPAIHQPTPAAVR